MARRRLNTPFLVIGAAVVAAIPAGLYAVHKLRPKDPAKLIQAGDLYASQQDLPDAALAYAQASQLRPGDAALHLRLAQVYYALRDQPSADYFGMAITEWTTAEELNPELKAAWQGLLEANMQAVVATAEHRRSLQDNQYVLPKRFGTAREAAQNLLKLDPTDVNARTAIPILTIHAWLLNLVIPQTPEERKLPPDQQPTDAQRIDQAITDLTSILRDHPENADLPLWIARAKVAQAQRAAQRAVADTTGDAAGPGAGANDPRTLLAEAASAFDDPVARQPHNAELQFNKFQVMTLLLAVDHAPEAIVGYQKQQREALDAAQANVAVNDRARYVPYKLAWADYVGRKDPGRAEALYKDLLKQAKPPAGSATDFQVLWNEVNVRLQYANMLARDQTRRGDALAVLGGLPAVPPQDLAPLQQQQFSRRMGTVRLARAQIETEQLNESQDPAERVRVQALAQADLDAAAAANPQLRDGADLLKAQGRLQLVTGHVRDAIQTLTAAGDRQVAGGGVTDFQLLGWEAVAYRQGQQTGEAIKLLERAVHDPAGVNNPDPHIKLAELYLDQQSYDQAKVQVDWLALRFPEDPGVVKLQIRALGREPDPAVAGPLYAKLPEKTPAQLLEKADWSLRLKNPADAERLDRLCLAADPGNPSAALQLAQLLDRDGNKGDANAVLDAAKRAHPEDNRLEIVQARINGAGAAALTDEIKEDVAKLKDPFAKAISLAKLAQAQNHPAEQIAHLQEARAIQPANAAVLNDLFVCYLTAKDTAKASALIPQLSDLDADQAHGTMFRFKLAMAQHDVPSALSIGHQLTHDYPQFAGSWEYLGEAQQAAGQLEAASQQYTAALDRQGNNPEAMQRLVECSIRLGRLDEARQFLADARKRFPDNPVYREQQVRLELGYGDPESVLSVAADALKDHPDFQGAYSLDVRVLAGAAQHRTAKGDADGAQGFLDQAKDVLGRAVKKWPDDPQFALQLADLQAQDGTDAGVAAAAATFAALGQQPKWAGRSLADVLTGRMYLAAKRPEAAEPPLRHALDLDSKDTDARVLLADVLVARHRDPDALAVLAPARDQPPVRSKYVDLLLASGQVAQAEAELSADLKANPDDVASANLLAHVYGVQGKWDPALDLINRTLAAHPNDAGGYYLRGTLDAQRPGPDLAASVRDLSVFCESTPASVEGHAALGRVLAARHDLEGAVHQMEMAVNLAPENKEARIGLARDYLASTPPRLLDASQTLAQGLAIPAYQHDPDLQHIAALVWLKRGDNDKAVASIRDAVAHAADQRAYLDDYLNILLSTQHYDTLLEETARFVNDPKATWTVYDFRARAKAYSGDTAGAYNDFSNALDLAGTAPTAEPAIAVAGHVTEQLGVGRAIELLGPRAENSGLWKLVLATAYNRVHDTDKALAAAEGAFASLATFGPQDQLSLTRMTASLYMAVSPPQGQKAIPLFKTLIRQDPNDVQSLNNMACVLSDAGKPDQVAEALTYSQRAFDRLRVENRVDPYVYDTQGWLLILNGRLDDGIDVLHQAIDQADFPDAHYHLAEGYLRKGLPEDAKRELDAAVDIFNGNQQAHKVVDESLQAKIAAAQKRADQAIQDKTQARAGP